MNRSQAREYAFKLLYQIEIQKEISNEDMSLFFENNDIKSSEAKEYIEDVVNGVQKKSKNIMKEIEKNLKQDWKIDRVSKINLALLTNTLIIDINIIQKKNLLLAKLSMVEMLT